MNPFVAFMQTPAGRVIRIVGGLAMIAGPVIIGGPGGTVLAVEVSTKPLINLVWLGAILMLGSVFLTVFRRALDLGKLAPARRAAKAA